MKKSIKELINDKLMVSLRQFEKEAGITRQTVYNIQNGKGNPTLLTVKKICAYFGVDYKDYI
jgi:DNA-binding XRE family transcriptional regulator